MAPGVTGHVVEIETGMQIKGVTVLEKPTNKQGYFVIPAKTKLGITIIGIGGHYPVETYFDVSAPGYQTRLCACTTITPNSLCEDVVIPLERGSQNGTGKKLHIGAGSDGDPVGNGAYCTPLAEEVSWRISTTQTDKSATISPLEEAAQNGSATALYDLGILYINGTGIEKDVDLGRYFIRRAAEAENRDAADFYFAAARQGDTEAQVFAGDMLSIGLGVEQNIPESINWYMEAAEQNDTVGMLRLAEIYSAGEVVPTDKKKSLSWYHKATETGSVEAMFELAEQYRYGLMTPSIDLKQAIHWYVKAAEAGSERAYDFLLETIEAKEISATEKHEALEWQTKRKQ